MSPTNMSTFLLSPSALHASIWSKSVCSVKRRHSPKNVPPPILVPLTLSNPSLSTLMILTPEPILSRRYGNNSSFPFMPSLFTMKSFLPSVKVNASSLIVCSKKFAPATAHFISSSFSSWMPNLSRKSFEFLWLLYKKWVVERVGWRRKINKKNVK